MIAVAYKGKNGEWKYSDGNGGVEQSCDCCSFMSVYLGIYTLHEVVIKIPDKGLENTFYHVTCKDYRIIKVERVIHDLHEWENIVEVDKFTIV